MRKEDGREILTSPHSLLPLLREPPVPYAPRASSVTGRRRRRPVSAVAPVSRCGSYSRWPHSGVPRAWRARVCPSDLNAVGVPCPASPPHGNHGSFAVSGSVVGPLAGRCVWSIARTAVKGLHLGAFGQALRPWCARAACRGWMPVPTRGGGIMPRAGIGVPR